MANSKISALDKRILRGAVAHYEDAAYYDSAYKRRKEDVRFYAALATQRGGPVLELGAGSGRVTLAMAEAGVDVVGVEPVPAMLAQAKQAAQALPHAIRKRVAFRAGDMRAIRLKRKFPLVVAPFNVFMHLYTRLDVERALATVLAHLAPRGRFVFDVSMPDLHAMTRPAGRLYRGPRVLHPSTGERYEYFEAFEYDAPRQVQMVSMVFQNTRDLADMKTAPLSQRQFFPQEIEALLHYNGLAVDEMWGDFERGPLLSESESQVIVAKRR